MAFILFTALSGCGGGGDGGDTTSSTESAENGQSQTALVVNNNYTGSTGSAKTIDFTMPNDGVIDFSLLGTEVSIYDQSLTLLHSTSGQVREKQFPLMAGSYKLKFYFWSARSKHAAAYSPSLMNPINLPLLKNQTYSALTSKSDYFILRMPMDGNIEFSGIGTQVSIYDLSMNKKNSDIENDGPISLLAGDYIVKFLFWSENSKSITAYSPSL